MSRVGHLPRNTSNSSGEVHHIIRPQSLSVGWVVVYTAHSPNRSYAAYWKGYKTSTVAIWEDRCRVNIWTKCSCCAFSNWDIDMQICENFSNNGFRSRLCFTKYIIQVVKTKFCELRNLPVWKNLKPQPDMEQDPEKFQHHSLPFLGVHSVRFRRQNSELISCFLT